MEKREEFSLFKDILNQTAVAPYDALRVLGVDSTLTMYEWWQIFISIFLWMTVSYMTVYFIAAIVATLMMRKHPYVLFVVIPMLGMSIAGPATVGAATSAVLSFALTSANKSVSPLHCLILGCAQTIIVLIVSFTRILATL